jgi:cobalt-zinc-cadmium efflux system outer membrane protein
MKCPTLVVATLAASFAASPAAAQAPQGSLTPLTIAQAVDLAVQHNLNLLAQRAGLASADAAIVTARLRPNPVLSAEAVNQDWLGTGFNDQNGAGPQEYAAHVDVPFEMGGKRERRIDLADGARRVAVEQLDDAVRRLRIDTTLAAVDILEAKSKLQLAQDNYASLQTLQALNDRRLQSGAIAPVEVARSRVAMLQYAATVRSAQLALDAARLKLLPLLGRASTDTPVDIVDPLRLAPAAAAPDLAALQQAARETRPDLRAAEADRARTQADLRLQVAQGKVDYTVGAEYRRQQGVNGKGNLLGLFVSVPLPVFNRNQGEIARAGSDQERAARTIDALQNDISAEVAGAYQEYESSRQLLVEIERDLLTPSDEARRATAYMYQAGATSLIDVLDAQRAYNDTMDTYYSAEATYRRAHARLALITGKDIQP